MARRKRKGIIVNERAVAILRDQLEARGFDVTDVSADEVLERGVEVGLITTEMADQYRGEGED